jgi:fucose 4-O-acetylase-like acetyltransferase
MIVAARNVGAASRAPAQPGSTRAVSVADLPTARGDRDLALDVLKGLLVLLMVLYHWLNYFVTSDPNLYKYLRFVTPSFIFIAGFLIAHVYLPRARPHALAVPRRLLARGLRLLALFTALNVAANLAVGSNYDGTALGLRTFLARTPAIYLWGDGRGAAFEVLVPIAYLLVASAALLAFARQTVLALLSMGLSVGIVGVYFLKWHYWPTANLELVTMGLLGMAVGCFEGAAIARVLRPRLAWVGAYALYLVALTLGDVFYSLQVVGLFLNVALLYMLAERCGHTNPLSAGIVVLGQYSLLGYIVHIAALQVLARAMRPLSGLSAAALALPAALAITFLAVGTAVWLRRSSPLMDRLYRSVFA